MGEIGLALLSPERYKFILISLNRMPNAHAKNYPINYSNYIFNDEKTQLKKKKKWNRITCVARCEDWKHSRNRIIHTECRIPETPPTDAWASVSESFRRVQKGKKHTLMWCVRILEENHLTVYIPFGISSSISFRHQHRRCNSHTHANTSKKERESIW